MRQQTYKISIGCLVVPETNKMLKKPYTHIIIDACQRDTGPSRKNFAVKSVTTDVEINNVIFHCKSSERKSSFLVEKLTNSPSAR